MNDKKTLTTSAREREYLAETVRERLEKDRRDAEETDGRERRMILADIELGESLEARLVSEPRRRGDTNTSEGAGEANS